MSHASLRAHQIMLGVMPDQRRQSRAPLPVSARITYAHEKTGSHVAFVRDANVLGAFLYSGLKLAPGESVQVELTPTKGNPQLSLNCEGTVVRVEESAMNGLTGFAVEFHAFEIQEPPSQPELQIYSPRMQGAA